MRRRAAGARTARPFGGVAPQLARLVQRPPEGDLWLHELKYDGYRVGCIVDDGAVRLVSRTGHDCTERFPEVVDAVRRLEVRDAVLDGEVAVMRPDGRTSFQDLQNALGSGPRAGLVYVVFDLLRLDGDDVARQPLEKRKARLARLLGRHGRGARGVLRFAEHVLGNGSAFFAQVCRLAVEGMVSKRRDLPYEPGRHGGWLKIKCLQRAELAIGGFTDPEGAGRLGIGALIVGRHDEAGRLACAGKVGTGFTDESSQALRRRLAPLETRTCPFTPFPPGFRRPGVHWLRPELVAEVAFSEWTSDGKIRQASFRGIVERVTTPRGPRRDDEGPSAAPRHRAAAVVRARRRATSAAQSATAVRLSHPDRVLYPDLGLTKRDVATYYEAVAEWIVPHVAGRPLTLVRCPNGIGESCFFMKHSRVWAPPGLRHVRIQEKTKLGEYLVADDLAGILALVQMDVLEIHTWNSTADDVERPNRLVLDLDPGPDVRWPAIVGAARLVRDVFSALGLTSFAKTTGGVGLHVVVPVAPALDWRECLEITRALADAIVRHDPRAYTTAVAKAGRERKILLDYLRNNRTNTSVAALSTRARAGAPVSMPLAWDELTPRLRPDRFTVRTAPGRLRELGDRWRSYWTLRQHVPPNARAALAAL